jgi:hypothetical protein
MNKYDSFLDLSTYSIKLEQDSSLSTRTNLQIKNKQPNSKNTTKFVVL